MPQRRHGEKPAHWRFGLRSEAFGHARAMSRTYDAILADLRDEIDASGARTTRIDEAVAELETMRRPGMTWDLLGLLSDAADDDAGMFTLVHAAEAGPAAPYVEGLLAAFPTLMERAPRWASIVLMRALNDAETQTEIVRQLQGASPAAKAAVRETCARIDAASSTFLAKTVPVTIAARQGTDPSPSAPSTGTRRGRRS